MSPVVAVLWTVTVEAAASTLSILIRVDPALVPVPKTWVKHLVSYVDKGIIFGLRPENIHDVIYSPPGIMPVRIPATVDVTELIGNEIFLHLLIEDKPFLARVDPRTSARPGHRIEVMLDLSRMHAFDPDTEQNLIG